MQKDKVKVKEEKPLMQNLKVKVLNQNRDNKYICKGIKCCLTLSLYFLVVD